MLCSSMLSIKSCRKMIVICMIDLSILSRRMGVSHWMTVFTMSHLTLTGLIRFVVVVK